MNELDLFSRFLGAIRAYSPDTAPAQSLAFAHEQWPLVKAILVDGKSMAILDARAHDLTCSFVEQVLALA